MWVKNRLRSVDSVQILKGLILREEYEEGGERRVIHISVSVCFLTSFCCHTVTKSIVALKCLLTVPKMNTVLPLIQNDTFGYLAIDQPYIDF